MKLIYVDEMNEIDQKAGEAFGITTEVLMENAGRNIAEEIEKIYGNLIDKNIVIFAGKGNNGGDAFVAARWLNNKGAKIKIILLANLHEINKAASHMLKICDKCAIEIIQFEEQELDMIEIITLRADIIIDGILGIGFKGELTGIYQTACRLINSVNKTVIAIDVPSGINADTGAAATDAIRAKCTISMCMAKIGMLLYHAKKNVGKLIVTDIGMPKKLLAMLENKKYLLANEDIKKMLPKRKANCHKGTTGSVLVVAGSPGFTGAAALASFAAVKIGAGIVRLFTPNACKDILAVKLTEVMVNGLIERMPGILGGGAIGEILEGIEKSKVLAIGPGLGTSSATGEVICEILKRVEIPVIIDADA